MIKNQKSEIMMIKPLFVPLYKQWFEKFESGEKTIEYRKYGPRWNEQVCTIGRPVILSCGYGKKRRLYGVVTAFTRIEDIAEIRIKLLLRSDYERLLRRLKHSSLGKNK